MPDSPESWEGLEARLASTRFDDLRHFEEIDSTNRYLLDEARAGASEGVVAAADHQTAGRGRLGRAWVAPARASLLVSVLLRPRIEPGDLHVVSSAAGVAACEAVFLSAGFAPSLKWPNDLVVGERKLAGMLTETTVRDGRIDAVVVGVGVNVNWDEFPDELATTATACNLVSGGLVDRVDLLIRFLERLEVRYATLGRPGGPEAVMADYRQRCSTIGRRVRVELVDRVIEGEARELDDDGRLVVAVDDGSLERITTGDVVHLRAPSSG